MSSTSPLFVRVEGRLHMSAEDAHELEIWMDGDCGLCRASRAWCELRDRRGRLVFRDFRTDDTHHVPLRAEDFESSMWVRDSDGELLEGFDAWRRIMDELPQWKWLARLVSLPPLNVVGQRLYRWIAANRHWFRG